MDSCEECNIKLLIFDISNCRFETIVLFFKRIPSKQNIKGRLYFHEVPGVPGNVVFALLSV